VKTISPRAVSADELQVIEAVLQRAPVESVSLSLLETLKTLTVVGLCECGCKSLYFSAIGQKDRCIADGVGRTAAGKQVQVMVWVAGERLSALDVIDYEFSGELPLPATITSLQAAS
jgi:hypothetical protein